MAHTHERWRCHDRCGCILGSHRLGSMSNNQRLCDNEPIHSPEACMHVEQLAARVYAEFQEMPGLQLTLSQAQVLWGLDHGTCESAVALLVGRAVLRMHNGRVVLT